jgi:small basic protein (TIGR04137 family)
MGEVEPYQLTLSSTRNSPFQTAMSQHKSLQGSSGIVIKRNVLKRFERVDLLKKRGQWKAGDRVQGLRKTKPDV